MESHSEAINGHEQEQESFSDCSLPAPVMDISSFITEILLVLRDIREEQRVQFRTLSEQIVELQSELGEVRRSCVPLKPMVTERSEFFPIKSVPQLRRLDEICEQANRHPLFSDLKTALENQCPDDQSDCPSEFQRIFDGNFALRLYVTREETPLESIPLDEYKAFHALLRETWKSSSIRGKRINRKLRYFLKLNRERSTQNHGEPSVKHEKANHPPQLPHVGVSSNKRSISEQSSPVSEPCAKRKLDAKLVPKKRKRSSKTKNGRPVQLVEVQVSDSGSCNRDLSF